MKEFIFDIGGVLLDYNLPRFVDMMAGDSRERRAQIAELRYDRSLYEVETGRITGEEYFRRIISPLVPDWTYRDLVEAWMEIFTENEMGQRLFRDLQALGRRVYVLSNLADFNLAAIQEKFPGLLDGTTANFYSFQMGLWKPDAAIYTEVCSRIGVPPQQCVFLDDTEECVEGARRVGMNGIHFSADIISSIRARCGLA
jgi:FMN phosphatase YigB (HAD superfamily)